MPTRGTSEVDSLIHRRRHLVHVSGIVSSIVRVSSSSGIQFGQRAGLVLTLPLAIV